MPLKEPAPEDPMELRAVFLPCANEEMLRVKAECFAEEFLRMGHTPRAVVGIFQNPFYVGAYDLLRKLGEPRIREIVENASRNLRPGCESRSRRQ